MSQSGYLFLGLTAIVAALSGVLAYAILRIFAAARAATRDERKPGARRRSWPPPWRTPFASFATANAR